MSWLNVSQIYFNFTVGTASGVFVIVNTVSKYITNKIQRSIENDIKAKYPRQKLNIDFKLIDTEDAPGKIYLIDLVTRERFWIASASTFRDLDYHWSDVQRIQKNEFNKYDEGPAILTRGIPGT